MAKPPLTLKLEREAEIQRLTLENEAAEIPALNAIQGAVTTAAFMESLAILDTSVPLLSGNRRAQFETILGNLRVAGQVAEQEAANIVRSHENIANAKASAERMAAGFPLSEN
jgi:hypothetical protein